MREFFSCLFKSNYNSLYLFFLARLDSVQDAEDAAQETFKRMIAHNSNVASLRSPRSYLFSIARNLLTDTMRAHKVRLKYTTTVDVETQATHSQSPAARIDLKERRKLAQKALAELAPRCREVFILHRFEQLTYKQIAQRLDISPRTVEHHIAKAVFHVRKYLADKNL
jgi:RNA polymerase sigma-70 factor (ECF subfamily)